MILLDQTDRRPIYEQIVSKLSELMIKGVLEENTPLPSVRNLASELSINPNTVQRAYNELDRLGFTYTVKGKGSFVNAMTDIRRHRLSDKLEGVLSDIEALKAAGITENELTEKIHLIYSNNNDRGGALND